MFLDIVFQFLGIATLYLFFNPKGKSFDEVYRTNKILVAIISIIEIVLLCLLFGYLT